MSLRDTLNQKPWIGVLIAVLIIAGAAFMLLRGGGRTQSVDYLAEPVTLVCSKTGEQWTMQRGRMLQALQGASALGPLNPANGIINPKTGKPTGFPKDRQEWERLIAEINRQREEFNRSQAGQSTPAGSGAKK